MPSKPPTTPRQKNDGHVLLKEKGRHCLYFVELPRVSHSLCCGAKLWPACPDYAHCAKLPPRPPKDVSGLVQFAKRRDR